MRSGPGATDRRARRARGESRKCEPKRELDPTREGIEGWEITGTRKKE